MFLHGTIEDKRFITQTVLSNATYYDGKLDVELHPVFDTLFRLSKEHELKKSTIEPSESVDFTNKKHFLRSVLIMAEIKRFISNGVLLNYQTKSQTKIIATLSIY